MVGVDGQLGPAVGGPLGVDRVDEVRRVVRGRVRRRAADAADQCSGDDSGGGEHRQATLGGGQCAGDVRLATSDSSLIRPNSLCSVDRDQ